MVRSLEYIRLQLPRVEKKIVGSREREEKREDAWYDLKEHGRRLFIHN